MSDEEQENNNVVSLKEAFDKPARAQRGAQRAKKPADQKPKTADTPFRRKPAPDLLPGDGECPVKALGMKATDYYFLDKSGQFISFAAKDLGRLNIIALFGGDKYLVQTWPAYGKDGEPNGKFNHDRLGPVLIESCQAMGLFDPAERVRGTGTWQDDDGNLLMHCGDILVLSDTKEKALRVGTGLRGRYLYPGSPSLPEPMLKAKPLDAASALLDQISTWNFARGETDAKLMLGWIGAALLGAAPAWRPMCWLTGNRGTGKSTLLKLVKWVIGHHGMISSADATSAGISQRVANSSRPVAIDELEASDDNRRARDIIALARIASTGDSKDRGSPGGQAVSFQVRNCFLFSSIIIPPLRPADKSRLMILELKAIDKSKADEAAASVDDDQEDALLGSAEKWEKIGRQLRGRLLLGWSRYRQTFRAYRRALLEAGHDDRGADQFGALGAAYDLLMYDGLAADAGTQWAKNLPAKTLAETSGSESDESECLGHLLAATPGTFTKGSTESVAFWLRLARDEITGGKLEENSEALRTLAKCGIKLYRVNDPSAGNHPAWELAIANTHRGLAQLFQGTQWASTAGSSSAWPQVFRRLPGAQWRNAQSEQIRLRIDGQRQYVTVLPWESVFPPADVEADRDEQERVRLTDRAEILREVRA